MTIGCRDMKYHHFQPFFTHNSHFSHSGPSNLLWNMNYWFRIHFYDKNEGSIISVRLVVLKIWPFTFLTIFRPIWTKKGPKKGWCTTKFTDQHLDPKSRPTNDSEKPGEKTTQDLTPLPPHSTGLIDVSFKNDLYSYTQFIWKTQVGNANK